MLHLMGTMAPTEAVFLLLLQRLDLHLKKILLRAGRAAGAPGLLDLGKFFIILMDISESCQMSSWEKLGLTHVLISS